MDVAILGDVLGQSLNLNYTGSLANYAGGSGPVTWTGTGSLGPLSLTETGRAMFTDLGGSAFSIAYGSTLQVGSTTITESLSILGSGPAAGPVSYTNATGSITIPGLFPPPSASDTFAALAAISSPSQ